MYIYIYNLGTDINIYLYVFVTNLLHVCTIYGARCMYVKNIYLLYLIYVGNTKPNKTPCAHIFYICIRTAHLHYFKLYIYRCVIINNR